MVRGEIKNCTPLWREAFPSQNLEKLTVSEHFFEVEMLKNPDDRQCLIARSAVLKKKIEMLKNCTLLWREAHVKVKMYKTLHARSTF